MSELVAVSIRHATEDDAAALQSFATRLFAEHLPGIFRHSPPTLAEEIEFIHSRIEPANSTMLVAMLDDEIVGLLDFEGGSRAEETHAGTFSLSVDRAFRGQSIGTRLVDALIAWAPAHGVSRIQAWAWTSNPRALELYERLGFEREGYCRRAVISDGEPVDVVLVARLL